MNKNFILFYDSKKFFMVELKFIGIECFLHRKFLFYFILYIYIIFFLFIYNYFFYFILYYIIYNYINYECVNDIFGAHFLVYSYSYKHLFFLFKVYSYSLRRMYK
jgi:hypothetical protein